MDRRKSLKLIATGAVAVPAVIAGCNSDDKKADATKAEEPKFNLDRNPDELKYEKEILAKERFFTDHEMATITLLSDIIIPKDEISGSASEAKVPEFIEFIVKDMPSHQVPIKGGLRGLDLQFIKHHSSRMGEAQFFYKAMHIVLVEQAKKQADTGLLLFLQYFFYQIGH